MIRRLLSVALPLAFWGSLGAPALADRVITTDGRVVTPIKARKIDEGYRLEFEHGEILVTRPGLIQAIEIEGDMSDYEPRNEDEREKLERGYVRFEGKWMSKPAYEAELERRYEAAKERLEMLKEHGDWRNAWEQETKHFIVRTNTSPELLEYYAELLEAFYDLMDDEIGIRPTPRYRKKKMTVKIYKSRKEFHEESSGWGLSPGVAGFFSWSDESLNFYHDYAEPTVSDWVGLHECTHLLTFLIDQQYVPQIWLNEAVADYFGSSEITRDRRGRIEIEPGKLQLDRALTVQQAIEDDSYVRLEDLFELTRDEFHAFEYAHAWSFVYFLTNDDDGKYRKRFFKAFKKIYTLAKGIESETVVYGPTGRGEKVPPTEIRRVLLKELRVDDVAELEERWKEFMLAIELDGPAARVKRGIRAVRKLEFDDALSDLQAAVDEGVEDPRAYWALARALYWSGQGRSEAQGRLEQAIELDPLNARYRYELSTMLAMGAGGSITISGAGIELEPDDLDGLDDETRVAAASAAGLAMELDPENDRYREWFEQLNDE